MALIANLNEVSFEKYQSFSNLKNIEKKLENKVIFKKINNSLDLFAYIKDIFDTNYNIEVSNCKFDNKYLFQSFTINNENEKCHKNIIIIKRLICENDTYTYLNITPDNDNYEYCDVKIEDIIEIIANKSLVYCLSINCKEIIKEEKIIFLNNNENVGKILLENNKEILYLDIISLVARNQNISEEIIEQMKRTYYADFIYNKIDIGFCIINFFCPAISNEKNIIMSNLLDCEIYGDAIVFLQNKNDLCEDDDNDVIININKSLFLKIYDVVVNKKKLKRKNNNFFNIYKELE